MNSFKDTIDKALEHQSILEIEYRDKKKVISKRLILPMYWDGDSIIVAFCFLREDDRHFNIKNMISATDVGGAAISRLPQPLHPKKVEFPSNKYFGVLTVVENLDRTLLFPFDYEVNISRGKVLVPPNKNLFLSTAEIRRDDKYITPDTNALRNFRKNDLQAFEVRHQAWKIDLESIQHFSDLKWVRLNHVSNKNLKDLYQIENSPTYLFMSGYFNQDMTDIVKLNPQFTELRLLELRGFELQDIDLSYASAFSKLEFLWLPNNSEFTGTGLRFIGDKTRILDLNLESTNVDNDGISEIVKFTNLSSLSLAKNKNLNLTRKGFEQLELLENLRHLDLWDTNLDDNSFQRICRLINLESLSIGRTKVSDKSMKLIENLRNLTHLNVYYTEITDKGLEHIGNLPNLKDLRIEAEKDLQKPGRKQRYQS